MKKILLVAILLTSTLGFTQVKGNKKIITKSYDLEDIESVKIDLYAKVTIDCSLDNKISIKADENLIELIGRRVKNGVLSLNQLKWIEASQKIEIIIGAPNLTQVETGTHDMTIVKSFENDSLKLVVPIGKIKVSGITENLTIEAENGTIDASELVAENAKITITGDSQTKVKVINELRQMLSDDARLQLVNTPKSTIGKKSKRKLLAISDIKWINIKIKNNSWNRHKLAVVGPKSDGSHFSYGFAMMPGTTKKERWTIGTKIYKRTSFGLGKLLATVTKENENQVIKLF